MGGDSIQQSQKWKQEEEFDRKYARKIMMLLAFLVVTVMYIEGMLTPSLPAIASEFGVTASQVSLVLSTYLVGGVAMTPIIGKIADIYGKKKVLSTILIIYAGAVSVTGFSPNFMFMVGARTLQGIGMSIMPLGMSLMREEFPREQVPKAQAFLSTMFGAGFAVSLPLGSLVSNDFGWRWTYHSAIPFVIALAIVTVMIIRESRYTRPNTKIDYIGAGLLAAVLSLMVFALSEGPLYGWASATTIGLFVTGSILIYPLVRYEKMYTRTKGEAILNFKLLSERNVMIANTALTLSGLAMFLSMQALTYKFELPSTAGFGKSILYAGVSLVPFALGVLAFGPLTGYLVSRTGVKPIAVTGATMAAAGFLLEATNPGYHYTLAFEFMAGAGLPMLNGSMINFVVLTVDPKDMGLATSMNGTFRTLGSSIGAPVAGSMMATFTAAYSITAGSGRTVTAILPSHLAFTFIFSVAAAAFIASALVVLKGREVLGKRQYRESGSSYYASESEGKPSAGSK